jgi:hypothetical protein
MDLIVIGGGCYGCYHTRQLLKAQRRGAIAARRCLLVDHNPACRALAEFAGEPLVEVVRADWQDFLREHLAGLDATTEDRLVPAPFAPHLLFEWLLDAVGAAVPGAGVTRGRCDLALGLPYEHGDELGNRFISAAGWVCPATCIEPARCPAIRAERTWELGDIVRAGVERAGVERGTDRTGGNLVSVGGAKTPRSGVELFTCRHYAFGIGTIPVAEVVAARDRLVAALRREPGRSRRVVVGTVSACHGVLGELVTRPPAETPPAAVPSQRVRA